MIERILQQKIVAKLGKGKAIIIIGPRQVGKTTLIKNIINTQKHLFLDADDPTVRSLLTNANTSQLKNIIGKNTLVFIDEAQRIENIGITLKIITDQFPAVQLLVSGSSAFELSNKINEPLTGRKWEYQLFPIAWRELEDNIGFVEAQKQLELRLIYGMYPDVINNIGGELEILKQLANSYLYKDILAYSGIRKPEILEKLLKALALQIGSEVSYNELSNLLGIDKNTVNSYIDLLEQGFVIFKLRSFSKNIRNEIKHNQKIYFYDNGIRNMVLGDFRAMEMREDKGALWENFLISERLKKINYENTLAKPYFWRTAQQQEIDYIEEIAGNITAYEIKWNPKAKIKVHQNFNDTYNTTPIILTPDNFEDFL